MRKVVWLLFGLAISINTARSSRADLNSTTDYYPAVREKLSNEAVNCTESIPQDWREFMRKHEPPNNKVGGYALVKYLIECLHAKLVHLNETSPFAFVPNPFIKYDIMLNQVVSLKFDGALHTKVNLLNSIRIRI